MSNLRENKKRNRVTISVPQDIDLNFRKMAAIHFSFKRGWYGQAVLEAMKLWITHHSEPKNFISDDSKEYLWNIFKNNIKFDSDDPVNIIDSVVDYFSNINYMDGISYKMDEHNITIEKAKTFESYIPHLITCQDDSIFLNCPVETIADTAIAELTGKHYNITSGKNTLIYVNGKSKSLDGETLKQKMLYDY